MKKLLYISFLFIFSISFAQHSWMNGTIYFKDGSEQTGQIKIPHYNKNIFSFNGKERIRFRKDRKSEKFKFGPDVVEKIVFGDHSTYVYLETTYKTSLFKEVIVEGRAKLYSRKAEISNGGGNHHHGHGGFGSTVHWDAGTSSTFTDYFILLDSADKAVHYIGNRGDRFFRNKSKELFENCQELVSDLKNKRYGKSDIFAVVEIYNECGE